MDFEEFYNEIYERYKEELQIKSENVVTIGKSLH